jgi:hypothetical protein
VIDYLTVSDIILIGFPVCFEDFFTVKITEILSFTVYEVCRLSCIQIKSIDRSSCAIASCSFPN